MTVTSLHKPPFTAFYQISSLIPFSSRIYADFNCIFPICIRVTLKNLWAPERNHSEIFPFKKCDIPYDAITSYIPRSVNHAVVLTGCECNAGSVKEFAIQGN